MELENVQILEMLYIYYTELLHTPAKKKEGEKKHNYKYYIKYLGAWWLKEKRFGLKDETQFLTSNRGPFVLHILHPR